MRFVKAAVGLCLLQTSGVAMMCQNVAMEPQTVKAEYEDERVRVVRVQIAPGESLSMREFPVRVVIPLTRNEVRATAADGIAVELKGAKTPARALAAPPTPRPEGYLEDRYHHWFFENQYVRVYDVRIPPGATTEFHVHAFDSVFVAVSGGPVSTQVEGGEWKAEANEPGSVSYSADSKQWRTHRVRNEGAGEFHVVVVQLVK